MKKVRVLKEMPDTEVDSVLEFSKNENRLSINCSIEALIRDGWLEEVEEPKREERESLEYKLGDFCGCDMTKEVNGQIVLSDYWCKHLAQVSKDHTLESILPILKNSNVTTECQQEIILAIDDL